MAGQEDLAAPGPTAYLLAQAQDPGLARRGSSLGLAGFSPCWADFPWFLSRALRSTLPREIGFLTSEAWGRGSAKMHALAAEVRALGAPSGSLPTSLVLGHQEPSCPGRIFWDRPSVLRWVAPHLPVVSNLYP